MKEHKTIPAAVIIDAANAAPRTLSGAYHLTPAAVPVFRRARRLANAARRRAVLARTPFDVTDAAAVLSVSANAARRWFSWLYAGDVAAPVSRDGLTAAEKAARRGGVKRHFDLSRMSAAAGRDIVKHAGDMSFTLTAWTDKAAAPADALTEYPVKYGTSAGRHVAPVVWYDSPADALTALTDDAPALWIQYHARRGKRQTVKRISRPLSVGRQTGDALSDAWDYINAAAARILTDAPARRLDAYKAARRGINALDRQYNKAGGRQRNGKALDGVKAVESLDALTDAAAARADALTAVPAVDADNAAADAVPAAVEMDAADVDGTPAPAVDVIDAAALDLIDNARPAVNPVAAAAARWIWDNAAAPGGRADAVRGIDIARAWIAAPADAPAAVADIIDTWAAVDMGECERRVSRRINDDLKKLQSVPGLKAALMGQIDARPRRDARRDFDAVNRRTERAAMKAAPAARRQKKAAPAPVAAAPVWTPGQRDSKAAPAVRWTAARPVWAYVTDAPGVDARTAAKQTAEQSAAEKAAAAARREKRNGIAAARDARRRQHIQWWIDRGYTPAAAAVKVDALDAAI